MTASIDYPDRMQQALRSMVADVLAEVSEIGLPGDHHFFIGIDTTHPGVDIPEWLKAQHPEEMVIVLQNWFEDLAVTADRFSVTLSFNNAPATLVVPLAALRSFVDPSVEFGLRFDHTDYDGDDGGGGPIEEEPDEHEQSRAAEVVSLDKFRR